MAIDSDGVRIPSTGGRPEADVREPVQAAVTERSASGNWTGRVLGGVLALLVLAGAVYYFTGDRAGPEIATAPEAKQAETAAPAVQTRPAADSGSQQAAPAAPPQPAPPPSQQSATVAPPVTPPAPPAAMTQTQTATSDAQPAQAPAAAPPAMTPPAIPVSPIQTATNNAQPAPPPPAAAAPTPMRDQPVALPDQPAAAPKPEITLVVKRGPANVRSAPRSNGRVVGTAARNEQVKEISRSGGWVEVETESGRGWISSKLLGPSQ